MTNKAIINNTRTRICVAPNGSFKTKQDHHAIPLGHQELATFSLQALNAGASMMHFHIRDDKFKQLLDAEVYQQAIDAIKLKIGNRLSLQVTTESAGIYHPQQQIQCMRDLSPEAYSVSVRELFSDKAQYDNALEFIDWSFKAKIDVQFIVYNLEDLLFYQALLNNNEIAQTNQSILFVLGRYTDNIESTPAQLILLIHHWQTHEKTTNTAWMCCAFGKYEFSCLTTAMLLGGDVRVGFENTLLNKHGKVANDNIELIKQVADFIDEQALLSR